MMTRNVAGDSESTQAAVPSTQRTTTTQSRPPASAADRRARVAVSILFLTNGAIFANLLPRYPEIKAELGLSKADLGLAVAAFPFGALVAGLAAGLLIRRFRSSRTAVAGTILTSLGVLLAALSPSWATLAIALFCAGAMDSVTDVAQNAHGLRVQRRYGRSILNSFHAIWSIGAVLGGLMGAAAISLGMSRTLHLGISAIIFSAAALTCYRFLIPGPERDTVDSAAVTVASHAQSATRARASSMAGRVVLLAALGVIAISNSFVEDSGASWAALYLGDSLGTTASIAAFGFVALTGAQFIGRITGDRMVDQFGQRAVARTGGAIAAIGMGLALAFPTTIGTIAGFAAAGFGIATLIPAVMHTADELPGLKPGTGLAVVSWLMRIGFLMSPPFIGFIADASSLRVALISVPVAGLLIFVLSQVLDGRSAKAGVGAGATTAGA